ncbi:MAG: polyprenyl synthetase family protein [Planctomycetota bacterium]
MAGAWFERDVQMVNAALEQTLADVRADVPPRLWEAMHYAATSGGKRLRPVLVLRWAALAAGSDAEPNATTRAAAVALELIHAFSLVHDDLPAMDDDDLRRGRPTVHKAFDEATAILAGDALVTLAFELLGQAGRADLCVELAQASGPVGMIGGQMLDIAAEGNALDLDGLQEVHRRKTGALLTAACRLGVLSVSSDAGLLDAGLLDAATRYGRHLGLAFQITDDLLDATATAEQTGKATGKDQAAGKNTYPALLGVDGARTAAAEQHAGAHAALAAHGEAADALRQIADLVRDRDR